MPGKGIPLLITYLKKELKRALGESIRDIILFGSQAENKAHQDGENSQAIINNGTWEFTTLIEDINGFNSPSGVQLGQNYPDPFKSSTIISFTIPEPYQIRCGLF
jgi:hypothetical protein